MANQFCPTCGTPQAPQACFCGNCGAQQQPAAQPQMITLSFQEKKKPINASHVQIKINGTWVATTVKKQIVSVQVPVGYHAVVLEGTVGVISRKKDIYTNFTRNSTIVVSWNIWHGGIEADVIL